MSKSLKEIVIGGFGGQGILFAAQVLATTANDHDINVTFLPSYGPEVRGGTCNAMVCMDAEEPIKCQFLVKYDILIAMNRPSLERFLPNVRSGGIVIINSDLVDGGLDRDDVNYYSIAADTIAVELGDIKSANMVAVGATLAATKIFKLEETENSFKAMLPTHKQKLIPLNIQAIERGFQAVSAIRR